MNEQLARRWFIAKWKTKRALLMLVAPERLHPETLFGVDGEPPHFVRADLADTPEQAAEYLARDNEMSVADYGRGMGPVEDIGRVWMVEHGPLTQHDPEFECEDDDCDCRDDEGQYDVVSEQRRGAVAYWRWGW